MTEDERAENAIQFFTDHALQQHLFNHLPTQHASAAFCEACGNEIPEARRKALAGVTLCVECKRIEESRNRMYS
jgi:phage/conjugal plasmid C-4 type zinc finger TraR family protein